MCNYTGKITWYLFCYFCQILFQKIINNNESVQLNFNYREGILLNDSIGLTQYWSYCLPWLLIYNLKLSFSFVYLQMAFEKYIRKSHLKKKKITFEIIFIGRHLLLITVTFTILIFQHDSNYICLNRYRFQNSGSQFLDPLSPPITSSFILPQPLTLMVIA